MRRTAMFDFVVCLNCGSAGTVELGEEICPECGKIGVLVFVDKWNPELPYNVSMEDKIHFISRCEANKLIDKANSGNADLDNGNFYTCAGEQFLAIQCYGNELLIESFTERRECFEWLLMKSGY